MDLKQLSVLVLGLGESGLAMARWCLREGAHVRVADTRATPPKLDAINAIEASVDIRVDVRVGSFTEDLLDGIDLIAISPGLVPTAEPQRSLLARAAKSRIPVCSEIELFAHKLAALKAGEGYMPRVVAITGTNGKTTVTRLVGKLCEAAGKSVAVAGNVSPAALDALADALDARENSRGAGSRSSSEATRSLPAVWVLELSSFQLETTRSLAADAAAVLNISQDHLDWHGDIDSYAKAKAAIFAPSTVRVLNRDDARVMAMRADDAPSLTFGLGPPDVAGSFGVVRENSGSGIGVGSRIDPDGLRWLAVAEGNDPDAEARGLATVKVKKGRKSAKAASAVHAAGEGEPVARESLVVRHLMPTAALRIRGDHNVANVLAALALGRAIGLTFAPMLRAVGAYRGEPHRVEFVLRRGGVDYIEDSKGTNVGATVAALRGLGQTVVLIAGGDGKGQDFSPLAAPVAEHARGVVLIGKDKGAIRAALAKTGVPLVDCATLADAVLEASRIAEAGDAVMLSPACASLDMFRDYQERAEVFVSAVQRLATLTANPADAEATSC